MRKLALYACVAVTSSILSVDTPAIAAPLSQQVGLTSSPRTLVEFTRRGADDNLKHRRRGGNDDGPGHVSHQSSSSRHGADDSAGHEHHGGGDDSGHGGNHGGGDDHGGRR
jgi:hypothetical protein